MKNREKFLEISKKVQSGERLSLDDGIFLYEYPDILALGGLANYKREELHGDITYYNSNLHLNATNVCEASCMFCSFARIEPDAKEAYTMSVSEAIKWIKERYNPTMTEVHIVNGLHRELDFNYYLDLLKEISREFPKLHIKGFTAVEIHYFAEKFNLSYKEVLEALIDAGLQSMPGGGAEIFSWRVRKKICRDKVDAKGWLKVHETAHALGLKSNCTMLYGTIETTKERVEHLISLREQQDKSGGFQAFIPLAYHPDNNQLKKLGAPSGADDLRTIAVSRLMLDNIPNIKAYWVMLGVKVAQVAQSFGANDLDGTVTEEKIYHMAGADTPNLLSLEELKNLIREVNRIPVERSTTYEHLDEAELQQVGA